jgi:hypothetical protein
MAGISLDDAIADLAEARANLSAIRKAQSTQISSATGGRRIDRAQMEAAMKDVQVCQQRVVSLSGGNSLKSWSAVPL